jgi:hypothetical protein
MYGRFPHLELREIVHNILSEFHKIISEIIARHKCRINIGPIYKVTEEEPN